MISDLVAEKIRPVPNIILLALQVDGFCQAMSLAMQSNSPVGAVSVGLLRKFMAEARQFAKGVAFQKYPVIGDDSTVADLLAVATVLRSALWAFLDSPSRSDLSEASHAFGLAAIHEHRNARPELLTERTKRTN